MSPVQQQHAPRRFSLMATQKEIHFCSTFVLKYSLCIASWILIHKDLRTGSALQTVCEYDDESNPFISLPPTGYKRISRCITRIKPPNVTLMVLFDECGSFYSCNVSQERPMEVGYKYVWPNVMLTGVCIVPTRATAAVRTSANEKNARSGCCMCRCVIELHHLDATALGIETMSIMLIQLFKRGK